MPDFTSSPSFPPSEDRCHHGKQELRRRIASNGVTHFVMQCLGCGLEVRKVSKTDPVRAALVALPPDWDPSIAERFYKIRTDRWKQESEARAAEKQRVWWENYQRYLDSVEWRAKATRRLMLDEHRCQARLKGCQQTATQVHHLSYDHVGNEPLWELRSICKLCHDQITEMDRAAKRGVAA